MTHGIAIDVQVLSIVLLQNLLVSPVVKFDQVKVLDEVEILHSLDHILSINSLALLKLRDFTTFARDEGDELTDALLNAFTRLFRNLCVSGERTFHDPVDVCDGQETLLISQGIHLILTLDGCAT